MRQSLRLLLLLLLELVFIQVRLVVVQFHERLLFLHPTDQFLLGKSDGGSLLLLNIAIDADAGVVARRRRVGTGLIATALHLFLIG